VQPAMARARKAGFIDRNSLGKIVLKKHCTENAYWYFARPFVGITQRTENEDTVTKRQTIREMKIALNQLAELVGACGSAARA